MEQVTSTGGIDRNKHGLCLLSLDGGGVRGLSSLYILQGLMKKVNAERAKEKLSAVKPCQVFDLIGGTSTGGLIAIMLGRLEMDVESCIRAYTRLMGDVFGKHKTPVDWNLNVKGRFSSDVLEKAIKSMIPPGEGPETALLNDDRAAQRHCRAFVCAVRASNKSLARLRSYTSDDMMVEDGVTIWQAGRATSAATSFFDPINIQGRKYVDGALGFNNPLDEVWLEAQDIWSPEGRIEEMIKCVVSIGTGNPGTSAIGDKPWTIVETLKDIVTQTEATERVFGLKHRSLLDEQRYYRFNVEQGLQDIGLEEYQSQGDILDATAAYLNDSQQRKNLFRDCAVNLSLKEFWHGDKRAFFNLISVASGSSAPDFEVDFYLSGATAIDCFVGRDEVIKSINDNFRSYSRQQQKIVILHGLGGMGKTQTAIKFAHLHHHNYTAVLWFNANDEDTLGQSFIQNADRLPEGAISKETLENQRSPSDLKNLVKGVKRWLAQKRNDRWLLIFDNVDNPKIPQNTDKSAFDIRAYFPEASHGSILITTRWTSLDIGKLIKLEKLEDTVDSQPSLSILAQMSKRSNLDQDPQMAELIEELDGLPLALATAGRYLRQPAITVTKYLQLYRQSWADLQRTSPGLLSYEDRKIYSTWDVSYQHICGQDEGAAKLLQLWAYFDNQDLWFELLAAAKNAVPDWLRGVIQSEAVFLGMMHTLSELALVSSLRDSDGFGIHQCVQAWITTVLNKDVDQSQVDLSLSCVSETYYGVWKAEEWALKRRLMPHANRCLELLRKDRATRTFLSATACDTLSLLYDDLDKPVEAEEMCLRALKDKEQIVGPDHVSTLMTVDKLGSLLIFQSRFVEAKEMLERALKGYNEKLGPNDENTLRTINNLALLYKRQGNLPKAEDFCLQSLEGKKTTLDPEDPSIFITYDNLASLYQEQGKMAEAEAMYLQALKGREKILGLSHTSTLRTVNNLGSLYNTQNKLDEAEILLLRASGGFQKAMGSEHTLTLSAISNLASVYEKQGKSVEAEDMYLKVLKYEEKALGLDHTRTLETVNNLASLYHDQGKLVEAEDMHLRALKGKEKALGLNHPSTLRSMFNLGNLYRSQGKVDEAEAIYLRTLDGRENTLGSDHKSTLDTLYALGMLYGSVDKLDEAVEVYLRALEGYEKVLGFTHSSTIWTAANLGSVYSKQGKMAEARKMFALVTRQGN